MMRKPSQRKSQMTSNGFQQLDFPAVAVPDLADVDDRHVHRPENRENNRVGIAEQNNERQTEACPCKDRQRLVRDAEPEERRHFQHASATGTELRLYAREKMIRRS